MKWEQRNRWLMTRDLNTNGLISLFKAQKQNNHKIIINRVYKIVYLQQDTNKIRKRRAKYQRE